MPGREAHEPWDPAAVRGIGPGRPASSRSSPRQVPVDSAEEGERPLAGAVDLAAQKREQRLRKFRELHLKRNEARKLNHQEVVEEDKRLKLPANWEAKKACLEWELQEEEKKKECAARGEDYEKVKLLEISAEDAERWERKKRRKNPDLGFSDYAAAQLRQYHRLTKQIKPNMETYERLREKHSDGIESSWCYLHLALSQWRRVLPNIQQSSSWNPCALHRGN
ncbi:pre-mRNA-splicing factor SYF2-like isoform X3 [Lutra lutra]|uniref:pre-mRNA-splicing factor SYF2-like isoform X3 n=1 Tax=Lutra lutra TaxID=9657 RepID=UPI001FD01802|nr:pre-mRNA-splicing factor SYF2-like isoform X3 [Lutra lutra]